ncbi:fibrillin-2-like isoform X48 [Paramuricea clavata]|uniref:Fibrillin-2-like isoform X48 n=1 Tax=Paramuricea clavata TaxID=317549 RepID=A0A7D9ETB8_PARCT|nr:fibrillin-2-like isoform X48 [Paramuricea clavata]
MICFHLTDNDECQLGTHICHQHASCQNTDGSFGCSCNEGYSGNGTTCVDINECNNDEDNKCSPFAICNNQIGTYECLCKKGFGGNGIQCDDIDECTDPTPPLRCRGLGQGCTNYPGAYRCSCISPRQQLTDDQSACVGMYESRTD